MYKIVLYIVIFLGGLSGCTTILNLHTDKGNTRDSIAILSPMGLYPDRASFTSIWINSVNGITVGEFVGEITLDPGVYKITYQASQNVRSCSGAKLAVCFDQAVGELDVDLKAGHTYIPNVVFDKDSAEVFLIDKGKNFPQRCLPRNMDIAGEKDPNKCDFKSQMSN